MVSSNMMSDRLQVGDGTKRSQRSGSNKSTPRDVKIDGKSALTKQKITKTKSVQEVLKSVDLPMELLSYISSQAKEGQ